MKKYVIVLNDGSTYSRNHIEQLLNDGYYIFKEFKFKNSNGSRYYQLILKYERTAKIDNILKDTNV